MQELLSHSMDARGAPRLAQLAQPPTLVHLPLLHAEEGEGGRGKGATDYGIQALYPSRWLR